MTYSRDDLSLHQQPYRRVQTVNITLEGQLQIALSDLTSWAILLVPYCNVSCSPKLFVVSLCMAADFGPLAGTILWDGSCRMSVNISFRDGMKVMYHGGGRARRVYSSRMDVTWSVTTSLHPHFYVNSSNEHATKIIEYSHSPFQYSFLFFP
jgi:hypothetical protein